jgi:DNA polymerase-3 subunit epsilon
MIKLEDITFCFLDVETTGLDCRSGDRICEIAMLKRKRQETIDSWTTLIDPECEVSEGAYMVNGISMAMLKGKPKFSEVAGFVLNFIDNAVIVCHNSPFDLGFLKREFEIAGLAPPQNPILDTLLLARKYYRFPDYKLKTVAEYMGLSNKGVHRASNDVFLTCQVFESFIADFQKKGVNLLEKIITPIN